VECGKTDEAAFAADDDKDDDDGWMDDDDDDDDVVDNTAAADDDEDTGSSLMVSWCFLFSEEDIGRMTWETIFLHFRLKLKNRIIRCSTHTTTN
jgi:hypothetical protein